VFQEPVVIALQSLAQGDRGAFDGLTAREYFAYDKPLVCDYQHLRSTLKIADSVGGDTMIYLLNPRVVAEDGEWEAWTHAAWIPGAERYPSFAVMMRREFETFCSIQFGAKAREKVGPFEGVYAPDRPRHDAERIGPGQARKRKLSIEELVGQLEEVL